MSGYLRNLARQAQRRETVPDSSGPGPAPDATWIPDPVAVFPAPAESLLATDPPSAERSEHRTIVREIESRTRAVDPVPDHFGNTGPRVTLAPAHEHGTADLLRPVHDVDPVARVGAAQTEGSARHGAGLVLPAKGMPPPAAHNGVASAAHQPWPVERSAINANWIGMLAGPARRETAAAPADGQPPVPEVHVSIGRIEVSAVSAAPVARPAAAKPSNTMSLAQYEAKRREGRR